MPSVAKRLKNMVGTRRLELLTSTVSKIGLNIPDKTQPVPTLLLLISGMFWTTVHTLPPDSSYLPAVETLRERSDVGAFVVLPQLCNAGLSD
jgi:hypothetical protein